MDTWRSEMKEAIYCAVLGSMVTAQVMQHFQRKGEPPKSEEMDIIVFTARGAAMRTIEAVVRSLPSEAEYDRRKRDG